MAYQLSPRSPLEASPSLDNRKLRERLVWPHILLEDAWRMSDPTNATAIDS